MGQDDQQPICCSKCGVIISQIEPDEESEYKNLHWGQHINYWSVSLHFWIRDIKSGEEEPEHKERENYNLCNKCKEKICKLLTSDKRVG